MHRKIISSAALLGTTVLASMAVATQVAAWRLGFQPALGEPLWQYGAIPVYEPWSIFNWLKWRNEVPGINLGLMAGAVVLAMPVVGFVKSTIHRPREFGKKEWAAAVDVKKAGLFGKAKAGGVVVGKFAGRLMVFCGDQHTLFVGASGSGKSSGPVISTLLSCTDRSMLVIDPKRELYEITATFRQQFGEAFFFDPTHPDSACFNPLDEIPAGTAQETAAVQNVAGTIIESAGVKNSDPFWPITATALLTGVILHVLRAEPDGRRHIGQVRSALFDLNSTMENMAISPHEECVRVGTTMLAMTQKTADAISLTARSALDLWADPLVVEKTSRSDFRWSDLACARFPVSLYLQVPPSDRMRMVPLFRLMMIQVLKAFTREKRRMADGREKKHRLQIIADEFPSMGKIPGFEEDIQVFRDFGVTMMILCQSVKSLEAIYGKLQTIRANCHIVTRVASSDPDEMVEISKSVDYGTEMKTSTTTPGGAFAKGSTKSVTEHRRPLLDPGAVRSLDMDDCLVLVTGSKTIRAKKVRWYEDKAFRHLGTNTRKGHEPPGQNDTIMGIRTSGKVRTLRDVLDRLGWSQKEMAERLFPGIPVSSVRSWIAGTRQVPDAIKPRVEQLIAAANGFDGDWETLGETLTEGVQNAELGTV